MELRQNAPQAVDPLAQLNEPGDVFKNPAQVDFVRTLLRLLRTAFGKTIMRDRAVPFFIMQSDSGKSFMVKVNDDGELVTSHVRG